VTLSVRAVEFEMQLIVRCFAKQESELTQKRLPVERVMRPFGLTARARTQSSF
jgi:hypothetical protein